jgi:hypothetical protein
MINKKFENKETGEIIKIVQDDEIWFTLSNGAKIKKESFPIKYTEVIDPNSFFSSPEIGSLANKLKNVDSSKVMTDNNAEPQVRRLNEQIGSQIPNRDSAISTEPRLTAEEQKQRLIEEYMQKEKQKNLSQYQQIDDEDAAAEALLTGNQPTTSKPPTSNMKDNPNYPEFDPNVKRDRDNKPKDYYAENLYKQEQPSEFSNFTNESQNEAYKFFRNFKKIYPIKVNLTFEEKIAEPEFIKLMSNNFEEDIIKFYTKQILQDVMKDPKEVEDKIYSQIHDIVFKNKTASTRRKPRTTKAEEKKDKE